MKYFKDWQNGNLSEFLNIGEEVDEDMVDYFIGVLPPFMKKDSIQIGEPYDHINGRGIYATLERIDGMWIYVVCKTRRAIK